MTRGRHSSPNSRTIAGVAVAAALVLGGLTGCDSGGTDSSGDEATTDLEAAQSEVDSKQEALADAEADFGEKSDAFCSSAETYLTALDRYGDVLTQTAPTVGDVED